MILGKNTEQLALLFGVNPRTEGEADIHGRHVAWKGGDVVSYIPFEAKKLWIKRTLIRPSEVKKIYEKTETTHWGALVSLTICDDYVIDIHIIDDVFADHMNVEL